jgi:hypothetical protein
MKKMKYLFDKKYESITEMFTNGLMEKQDYFKFVEYFESETTKKLFTINLN